MYHVAIKIEEMIRRRKSAKLMHLFIGFFLLTKAIDYYKRLQFENLLPALPAFLVAGVSIAYFFLRKTFDPLHRYHYWLRLLQVLACVYLVAALWRTGTAFDTIGISVLAIVSLILYFTERNIFEETNLSFTNDGVQIPGYLKNHLVPWTDLTEVVVREDFITLFHVERKYLQYQVLQDLSTLEVAKMNAFCKEKLAERANRSVES